MKTLIAHCLTSSNQRLDWETETLVLNDQGGNVMEVSKDVTGTLRAQTHGHEPIVLESNQSHAVCYSFDSLSSNSMKSKNPNSGCREVNCAKTLDTSDGNPAKNQGGVAVVQPPITFKIRQGKDGGGKGYLGSEDKAFTLSCNQDQQIFCAPVAPCIGASGPPYAHTGNDRVETEALCWKNMQVRRLTPLEAERLQGFPSVIYLDVENMNRDEAIAFALANNDIIVDKENGKVFRTRGNFGKKLDTPLEIEGVNCNGYKVFSLHAKGKKWQVRYHRVIWISENGIPQNGMVVDHINGNKTDNRISNLQLLTPEENSSKAAEMGFYRAGDDSPRTKLPVELRSVIFTEYQNGGISYKQLAEKYGISRARIAQIVQHKGYTDIPFKGKPAPDSARYKALGNSMAVPVMRWIGERIQQIEDNLRKERLDADGK